MVDGSSSRYLGDNGSSLWAMATAEVAGPGTSLELWATLDHTVAHPQGLVTSYRVVSGSPVADFTVTVDGSSSDVRVDDLVGGVENALVCTAGTGRPWADGSPHMFDVVLAGGILKIYGDGALCGSTTGNATTWAATDTTLAGFGYPGHYSNPLYTGNTLGQVSWYPFELGPGDIANHYAGRHALPASVLAVDPKVQDALKGSLTQFVFTSTSSGGTPVDGHPYTLVSSSPAGGVSGCSAVDTAILSCTVSSSENTYTLTWADALGNHATSLLVVHGYAASFTVLPPTCNTAIGSACNFEGHGTDGGGTVIPDPYSFGSLPANVTCVDTRSPGTSVHIVNCYASVVGTYVIPFHDAQGITAKATMMVAAASNVQSCGATDVGCWISNLVGAVNDLAMNLTKGLLDALFVSSSGKSFIDWSAVALAVPNVACRDGEVPTAPDGVHCWPFPFAVPAELEQFANIFVGATPTAPTWTMDIDVPPVHVTHTVDLRVFLTDATMARVRDAELLLFTVGLVFGTWRVMAIFGVA
jgi:hypothetical protein